MGLEKILNSKLSLKIIKFFFENPYCIDTAKGISIWTELSLEKTQKTLEKLSAHKIVIIHKSASIKGYAFTPDKKIIAKIKKIIKKPH